MRIDIKQRMGTILALIGRYRDAAHVGPFFCSWLESYEVAWWAREHDGMCVPSIKESSMPTVIWDTQTWAERNFGTCELGDQRRNKRLVKLAVQAAVRPDGSLPDQTETWGDCRAAYRLFDCDDVSFQEIIAPHCRLTRESCVMGETKLIINDTTELDFTSLRKTTGLGPIGNGLCRGFFLHTAMMIDEATSRTEGLAAQDIFYRKTRKKAKPAKNARRRKTDRESAVWGRVIDDVGAPPAGVTWIHLCDRGADDLEVMWKALHNNCGFCIRAARLNRNIITSDGRTIPLAQYLTELPDRGQREIPVCATTKAAARTATVTLHYGNVELPLTKVLTPWLKANRPTSPLRVGVVELIETNPPRGSQAIRWVIYSNTPVTNEREANQVIARYEQRPRIEDYHKALKSGCKAEDRRLETAARLERVLGLDSVVAIRLMQLKTAARETPARPAKELVPPRWIEILQRTRKLPKNPEMTIHQFLRQMAGLGGFLLRKGDREPGWITIWRGFEKLAHRPRSGRSKK